MREYRKKLKCDYNNDNLKEKQSKRNQQNTYLREYKRKRKLNADETEIAAKKEKQSLYMREYRKKCNWLKIAMNDYKSYQNQSKVESQSNQHYNE